MFEEWAGFLKPMGEDERNGEMCGWQDRKFRVIGKGGGKGGWSWVARMVC